MQRLLAMKAATLWQLFFHTPKLLSRIDSFSRHAFQHRFAAFRADRGVGVRALFGSEGKSFGGQGFCKTAFGPESCQLVGQLFPQHHELARATSVSRISVSFEVACREFPSAMLAGTDRAACVIWSYWRPHGSLERLR